MKLEIVSFDSYREQSKSRNYRNACSLDFSLNISYRKPYDHMIPFDRCCSVTEMKLVSVHMATFRRLSEIKNLKKW